MNLDRLKRFPNQGTEDRYDECVGETWADIIGNIYNQPMDAGYNYASALRIANSKPTTAGSDPYSGGFGGLVYGAIPTENEPFDATTTSELYEANIANYPSLDRMLALNYTLNGIRSLFSYKEIVDYLNTNQTGVQIGVDWFQSFNTPNPDGTLPEPSGLITDHCIAAYEVTPKGVRIKSWQGPNVGDNGYLYMPEDIFNQVFVNAARPILIANRWVNLVITLMPRWYLFNDIYPQLSGKTPFI